MIVRASGDVECWGSTCYKKELGEIARTHGITARYTSGGGRALTDDERAMLLNNRLELVAWLQHEWNRLKQASHTLAPPVMALHRSPAMRLPLSFDDAEIVEQRLPPPSSNYAAKEAATFEWAKRRTDEIRQRRIGGRPN